MDNVGETIKKLREEKVLPLRTVVAFFDQAILGKSQKGQRKINREQLVKLAEYFKFKERYLFVAWFSDKLVHEVVDE